MVIVFKEKSITKLANNQINWIFGDDSFEKIFLRCDDFDSSLEFYFLKKWFLRDKFIELFYFFTNFLERIEIEGERYNELSCLGIHYKIIFQLDKFKDHNFFDLWVFFCKRI